MRADYIAQQRQLIKTEVEKIAKLIDYEIARQPLESREKIKSKVIEAHTIAENIHLNNKGRLADSEIKKVILEALSPIRYDHGNGYYFIVDVNGVQKLNPESPDRTGTNIYEITDTHGEPVVKNIIDIANSPEGEGFYQYYWTKPDNPSADNRKISFVKKFAPFDWIIGTGVYRDDIESSMLQAISHYVQNHRFGTDNHGYVFVNELLDIRGGKNFARVYINPNRPDETGQFISDDFQDAKGKMFRKEFLAGLRQSGECFVDYWYRKIAQDEPSPKTSFFKLVGHNRFIVAAGLYLDDIEKQISVMQFEEKKQLKRNLLFIASIFMVITSILVLLLGFLNKTLATDFQFFVSFFENAAYGSQQIPREKLKFIELDRMATIANQMIDKKAEDEEALRLAAKVFDNSNDGITVTDANGNIVAINKAFTEITGYTEAEVLGKNPNLLQSGRQDELFYRQMWDQLEQKGYWQGEIWNKRKNHDIYPEWLTISAIHDDAGKVSNYVAVFSDITQIKESTEKLAYQAHHHPLTHLPNRLLLSSRLNHSIQKALREEQSGAVIFIDLDNFKNVNDSLGHSAGDEVLLEVARRLKENQRETDTVAHLSGDEFVIVLEDIKGPHNAAYKAEQILNKLNAPFHIHSYELSLNGSLGITLFPSDGTTCEELLKNSDAAMYQAKNLGKNRFYFFSPKLTAAALERISLEGALRSGIERQELVLYYQPQIDLFSQNIIACEALVRWQHPDLGLVAPDKFIPISEESGLIIPMGEWILETACRQFVSWMKQGLQLKKIAVNLSGKQIQNRNILSSVQRILKETECPPECLELEITESFVMQQPEKSISTLEKMRGLGVSLSIDDFGTGLSSLSYLKTLPISRLKIDKSFVRDIHQDENDEAIVKAIIALGKNLDLQITAEGIETENQLHFLKNSGCDEGQGFLISRPLPADQFASFLQAGTWMSNKSSEAETCAS